MARYLCLPLIVLVLLLSGAGAPVVAAAEPVQGDVNCDSSVTAVDSLQILRDVAGLATTAQCLAAAGDVNCDASPNSVDALGILRYVASLNVQTPDGCTPIGDALGPLSPQVLAARLNAAADTGHAEALLRLVYPEIDVGLYTGDGQQILTGAETGPDDFYLYDSESELLARNYVERQLFGLSTSTLFLEEAGVVDVDSGQPLSDAEVLSLLADGVAAARADESLFTWRLIDELGLAQEDPLDLAAPGLDPATTYLDSVQTFLILYDMTLGLPVPAGASAEVPSAGGPNARTQALHDYSLLAQGYSAYSSPVASTHWKHVESSVAEERTLKAALSFLPTPKMLRGFTAGPLRLVALPSFGADNAVEGAPVTWLGTELLKNGAWKKLANNDETNAGGEASIVFVPKTESCPGKGSVQTKTPTVFVTFQIEVKSAFSPHRNLGVIIKLVKTEVEVSRHIVGGAASAAGAGAADPSEDLPCAYEGTASATQNFPDALGGTETRTITASNLRFELKPPDSPFEGLYELVRGTVTVQVNGTQGDCTISGGYSISEPIDNAGDHFFAGFIILHPQSNTYVAAGGQGDWEKHLVLDCPPPLGRTTVPAALSGEPVWLRTNNSQLPDLPFTPGDPLQGSFDFVGPYLDATAHYEWSFDPIVCSPSPQPICQ